MTDRAFCFVAWPDGSLVLSLDGTCIQATARQAYRELTSALLATEDEPATMAALLDLLAAFLRSTDFAALRAEHPDLRGDIRCWVRLYRHEPSGIRWERVASPEPGEAGGPC